MYVLGVAAVRVFAGVATTIAKYYVIALLGGIFGTTSIFNCTVLFGLLFFKFGHKRFLHAYVLFSASYFVAAGVYFVFDCVAGDALARHRAITRLESAA